MSKLNDLKIWTVLNSAVEIASNLDYNHAKSYLTPERLKRGWCMICIIDNLNFDLIKE